MKNCIIELSVTSNKTEKIEIPVVFNEDQPFDVKEALKKLFSDDNKFDNLKEKIVGAYSSPYFKINDYSSDGINTLIPNITFEELNEMFPYCDFGDKNDFPKVVFIDNDISIQENDNMFFAKKIISSENKDLYLVPKNAISQFAKHCKALSEIKRIQKKIDLTDIESKEYSYLEEDLIKLFKQINGSNNEEGSIVRRIIDEKNIKRKELELKDVINDRIESVYKKIYQTNLNSISNIYKKIIKKEKELSKIEQEIKDLKIEINNKNNNDKKEELDILKKKKLGIEIELEGGELNEKKYNGLENDLKKAFETLHNNINILFSLKKELKKSFNETNKEINENNIRQEIENRLKTNFEINLSRIITRYINNIFDNINTNFLPKTISDKKIKINNIKNSKFTSKETFEEFYKWYLTNKTEANKLLSETEKAKIENFLNKVIGKSGTKIYDSDLINSFISTIKYNKTLGCYVISKKDAKNILKKYGVYTDEETIENLVIEYFTSEQKTYFKSYRTNDNYILFIRRNIIAQYDSSLKDVNGVLSFGLQVDSFYKQEPYKENENDEYYKYKDKYIYKIKTDEGEKYFYSSFLYNINTQGILFNNIEQVKKQIDNDFEIEEIQNNSTFDLIEENENESDFGIIIRHVFNPYKYKPGMIVSIPVYTQSNSFEKDIIYITNNEFEKWLNANFKFKQELLNLIKEKLSDSYDKKSIFYSELVQYLNTLDRNNEIRNSKLETRTEEILEKLKNLKYEKYIIHKVYKNGKIVLSNIKSNISTSLQNEERNITPIQNLWFDIKNKFEKHGIKVELRDQSYFDKLNKSNYKGFMLNGVIFININKATIDTPFHELSHILIAAIRSQNNQFYQEFFNYLKEIIKNEKNNKTKNYILKRYSKYNNSNNEINDEQLEEYIVDEFAKFILNEDVEFDNIFDILKQFAEGNLFTNDLIADFKNNAYKSISTSLRRMLKISSVGFNLGNVIEKQDNELKSKKQIIEFVDKIIEEDKSIKTIEKICK